ncbi:MAG: aspartate--tRNA ligase [Patescibacteria group bacterium]
MANTRIFISDTPNHIGETITVYGWIHSKRVMGQTVFIDLRDSSGLVQVVFGEEMRSSIETVKPESVVMITGEVVERGGKNINEKITTGKIEIQGKGIEVKNESLTPPFEISQENVIDEETRLKYRYLDLRHERMHQNLIMRHKIIAFIRGFLDNRQFVEVETPLLSAPTPEGARDFLVPSRKYKGSFYALPQAPQQYKQLLMVAGLERYYQIARCFRDEDSRGDRQPEFTQLDLEMSFVDREDVIKLNEELLIDLVTTLYPNKKIQTTPFPKLTYAEVMEKYGTDRPDLRKDKNDPDLLAFCWITDFPFFERVESDRPDSAEQQNEGKTKWTFTHNPFSAPLETSTKDLLDGKNIDKIISAQYDIALNGFEIGGGSIRNHKPDALLAALKIMGYDTKKAEADFGHLLEAFRYGAPPHGGIAWGLDRLVMILQNEPNIREVIAFPKTDKGRDPMMDSPREVDTATLNELGLTLKRTKS